jgi:hypothetical protein
MLLAEIDPFDILISDIEPLKESEKHFVFEHLLYMMSKIPILPTLLVKLEPQGVIVKYGYLYLEIARILKRKIIRVVVDQSSSEECIQNFLQASSLRVLNWEEERQDNLQASCKFVWYVFFFERAINDKEKNEFEKNIVNFFRELKLPIWAEIPDERIKNLSYQNLGMSAEFEAYVTIADESWYRDSMAVLINFHSQCVPIASFQGRHFLIA